MEAALPPITRDACRFYYHDVHDQPSYRQTYKQRGRERVTVGPIQLPPRYTPARWQNHQHSMELWMQNALQRHPWRTRSVESADIIFVAANFSMWCIAGKHYSARKVWGAMVEDPLLWPANGTAQVKIIALQYQGCPPPWTEVVNRQMPRDIVKLRDTIHQASSPDIVAPYVVSKPPWLVGLAPPPPPMPWTERKLLFFAGHVPKPYLAATRYLIWRQVRRSEGVTTFSPTLGCTFLPYAACDNGDAWLAAQPHSWYQTHCHPWCGNYTTDGKSGSSVRRAPVFCDGACTFCAKVKDPQRDAYRRFRTKCRKYKLTNFTDEAEDMARTTLRLPHDQYLKLALAHRFCLVAPGDHLGTHKVAEALTLGGRGGCIPVFVVPAPVAQHAQRMLPYTRWLDYCDVAFFVSESAARSNFAAVLTKLRAVSATEADAKLRALRRMHSAFVVTPHSSLAAPGAAERTLVEACVAGRQLRTNLREGAPRGAARKLNLGRCEL
jgi:hypothetical protein